MDEFERYASLLTTVAITGTNGKTTTTSMVAAIVEASGEPAARVTTVGSWVGEELIEEEGTVEGFARTLRMAVAAGVRTLAVETTSRALAEGFAHHWQAQVAVFTNLSRDHLDYHETPEKYLAAKAQLFMTLPPDGAAIFNACDEASALLREVTPPSARCTAFGCGDCRSRDTTIPLGLWADRVVVSRRGTELTLAPGALADRLDGCLRLSVIGSVHAENAMAAALAAEAAGYSPDAIKRGLEGFPGVAGRFQIVARAPLVVVDYAHTPDALQRTLQVARSLIDDAPGRVICVFGCGGDRDAGKRGLMGRSAADLSDCVIITTDNPRSEDPAKIADAIAQGARQGRASVELVEDRRTAIAHALGIARPDDVVVIAGRGGERVQEIGGDRIGFSDAEVAAGICSCASR
ncbi:MAG: UDP-N-acetylmuramyl-tripeptide synthetase [Deltaproteobacteria bacterium]|nr:UDP-N-acetylmuramyl-tripeptide synthetase [Deltaproteobacteria bacterium]